MTAREIRSADLNHPLLARLRENTPIICDGAMGTMLYSLGVPANHCFDECNLSQPDLVRQVHKKAEEYRVSIRNHRREANDKLKQLNKDKKITEDQLHATETKVQQLTTTNIEKLEKILAAKEAEVMEV